MEWENHLYICFGGRSVQIVSLEYITRDAFFKKKNLDTCLLSDKTFEKFVPMLGALFFHFFLSLYCSHFVTNPSHYKSFHFHKIQLSFSMLTLLLCLISESLVQS